MDPDPSEHHVWPAARAPVPLRVAAVVVAAQGLCALVFGIVEAVNFTTPRAAMVVTTSVFFMFVGAGLVLCARELVRLRSWARGPVLLAQLMSLGLAWNFRGGETTWISIALAVPALIALFGMLHPQTVEALND